jgi:hypothetical protein
LPGFNFQQQQSAGKDPLWSLRQQGADQIQPIRASVQRQYGFVARNRQFRQFVVGNIGQIGADQVKYRPERFQQAGLHDPNLVGHAVQGKVVMRAAQGCAADIRGDHAQAHHHFYQGDRDTPAAAAHVGAPTLFRMEIKPRDRLCHQQFCFRAGNEHLRTDPKREAVKFLDSRQVGQWHAAG